VTNDPEGAFCVSGKSRRLSGGEIGERKKSVKMSRNMINKMRIKL
jgi:hypothetical protein